MTDKEKKLLLIYLSIVTFAFLVGTGLFYIAQAYDIPFLITTSSSRLNSNASLLNVDFTNSYIENKSANDFMEISKNGNRLSFVVNFDEDNIKIIKFKLKNTGDKNAVLSKLMTRDPDVNSGLTIIWPNVVGVVLKPGEKSDEYSVVIIRDKTGPKYMTDIRAELEYTEYIK